MSAARSSERIPAALNRHGTVVKDTKHQIKPDSTENVKLSRSLNYQRQRPVYNNTVHHSKTNLLDTDKAIKDKPPKPVKSEQTLLRSLELSKEKDKHSAVQNNKTVASLRNKSRSHNHLSSIHPVSDHLTVHSNDLQHVEGAKSSKTSHERVHSCLLNKKCVDQINKLNDVIHSLTKRLDYLESQRAITDPPAFTACIPYGVMAPIATGSIITSFNDVISNIGGHFDHVKGEFTAPKDAVYVTCVTIKQAGEGYITVDVIYRAHGSKGRNENRVCTVQTEADRESASCVGVVRLEADDQVYLRGVRRGSARLNMFSSFSCFELN